ncbi:hypothetical protein [Sphingorhabdus sp. M41]|uniref:hypothetical protein n=1 Tax=Sphingorhabdus sp. M41 TaxID=1806885 RepID=UPI00078DD1C9|nr:hypothetical protein [Sphingorhabdus sp. M41]AMO72605.1 hypothetical protein AZE99_12765 [Sphingorhabdus sp. M41]
MFVVSSPAASNEEGGSNDNSVSAISSVLTASDADEIPALSSDGPKDIDPGKNIGVSSDDKDNDEGTRDKLLSLSGPASISANLALEGALTSKLAPEWLATPDCADAGMNDVIVKNRRSFY